MKHTVYEIVPRSGLRIWSMLAAMGAVLLLVLGHPLVLRFTPGPAGGGIPPGFFAGLATPAGGAVLAQGLLAIGLGLAGRWVAMPPLRWLRRSAP